MSLLKMFSEIKTGWAKSARDALRQILFGGADPTPKVIVEKLIPAGYSGERLEKLIGIAEQRHKAAEDLAAADAMQPEVDAAREASREATLNLQRIREENRSREDAAKREVSEMSIAAGSLERRQSELRERARACLLGTADPAIAAEIDECRYLIEQAERAIHNLNFGDGSHINTRPDGNGGTIDLIAHRAEETQRKKDGIQRHRTKIAELERRRFDPEAMSLEPTAAT